MTSRHDYHFIKIRVFESFDDLKERWLAFEKTAISSIYQSFGWCYCWQETIGVKLRIKVRLVVGFYPDEQICFILPLQIRKSFGLSLLEWHGTPDLTHGFGLYAQDFLTQTPAWVANHFPHLLTELGHIDVINLNTMPQEVMRYPHPLHGMFNITEANASYLMALAPDYQALYQQKRSKNFRKNRVRSDTKLAQLGVLYIGPCRSAEETSAALNQMFADKIQKLGEIGIHHVFTSSQQAFIHRLSKLAAARPYVDVEMIKLDEQIIAVSLGGRMNGCYWFYMTAMSNGPLRHYSPGDLLLRWKIEQLCKAGERWFDFGIGEADYKQHWSDFEVKYWSCITAKSARGWLLAFALTVKTALKRFVKQRPLLYRMAYRLRKTLRGQKSTASAVPKYIMPLCLMGAPTFDVMKQLGCS